MSGHLAFSGMLLVLIAMIPSTSSRLCHPCQAQDTVAPPQAGFRVATDVFVGNEKEPRQQTLTLFSGGVAYDISYDDPSQITMIDPARDRIVLLNKTTKTQTSIDLKELYKYIESARNQAKASKLAPYLLGADKIEVTDHAVTVGDSVLQYASTLQQPRDEQMAEQYLKVADALILLNGRDSGIPPFARLSLNRVVAEKKSLPEEIVRTTSNGKQTEVVRCRLLTNWRLSKDDENRIAEIGKMLVTYEPVSGAQFK